MYRAAHALGRCQCLRPIGLTDALKLGVMHQIKALMELNSQSEQWLDICKFQLIQAILQIKKRPLLVRTVHQESNQIGRLKIILNLGI
jgi:hypothetical protein